MIAPLLLILAASLIYMDYRTIGVLIAVVVAILALSRWYWMFQRRQTIDFDTPTSSGRPVRARAYLFWVIASVVVVVFGILPDQPLTLRQWEEIYVSLGKTTLRGTAVAIVIVALVVIAVPFSLVGSATRRKNDDPVNIGLMGALAMTAEKKMTQEELIEYIQDVFTSYEVPITRSSVATRLIWASTMVDQLPLDRETKNRAATIAKSTPIEFPL